MITQVLFIVVMLVICFGIILHHRFLRLMRVRHPSIWRSTGQPTVFSVGGSLIMSIPLLRFLWRKEYLSLDDQEFTRWAGFVRGFNAFFICFLVAWVVLSFTI